MALTSLFSKFFLVSILFGQDPRNKRRHSPKVPEPESWPMYTDDEDFTLFI